jgi:transcriptional regulator with XRE-family HTH domain
MTEQQERVPVFTRGDRMRVSLRDSGVSAQEIANYLGVTRFTVSTWLNDRNAPSTATMRLWALRTGVPYAWLAGLPRLDSNQQPSGYRIAQVRPRPRAHMSLAGATGVRHLRRVS